VKRRPTVFLSPEQLGSTDDERKAVYDIYCTADDGSHFIVELQRARQRFFKDRTVFYASFPIRAQAKKGDWNYEQSLKIYRDLTNVVNTAYEDGVEEGVEAMQKKLEEALQENEESKLRIAKLEDLLTKQSS